METGLNRELFVFGVDCVVFIPSRTSNVVCFVTPFFLYSVPPTINVQRTTLKSRAKHAGFFRSKKRPNKITTTSKFGW